MTHSGPQDPYGQQYPQQPPNPYGQRYAPQQQQPMAAPHTHVMPQRRSQGLAITALVVGVVAAVIGLTALHGVAIIVGLIAAILAVIALIARSQGGKMFAAGGLALGMAALPLAFVVYTVEQNQVRHNEKAVDCMQKAIEQGKSVDEIWACD